MSEYNIVDIFYSLKGEGRYTGCPMAFVRLAECNLNCSFCDTDYTSDARIMTPAEIIKEINRFPETERVVITGGEPLMQDVFDLVNDLRSTGHFVHLETNGTLPPQVSFDWVAVSPKCEVDKLNGTLMSIADEVKFLVGFDGWREYIDDVLDMFPYLRNDSVTRYIMPIADGQLPNVVNVKMAIDYALKHPDFWYCIQEHKVLGIK